MSQKELLQHFQDLSETMPKETLEDSEHHQRIMEMVDSLERQRLAQEYSPELIDELTSMDGLLNQLVEDYQSEHPKSAAILQAIKTTLSNVI